MKKRIRSKINRHRELAKTILENYPNARNDDWDLLFWALNENNVYIPFSIRDKIKKSGLNYHSLLRERQKLQSEGYYIPTDLEIIKRRRISEEVYREHYSRN